MQSAGCRFASEATGTTYEINKSWVLFATMAYSKFFTILMSEEVPT